VLKNKEKIMKKRTEKNMPDYYKLSFVEKNNPKNITYGIQQKYHKEAKQAWIKENALIIEDAITGENRKVHLEFFDVFPIDFGEYDADKGCFNDEYSLYVKKVFDAALKKNKSLKGLKVGKLIRTGVGDGYAFYEITKIKGADCNIEWRGFGDDRYFDQVLGSGGIFPKRTIKSLIRKFDFH